MNIFKIPKVHWRHYFGALSFLILILQLASGIFLIFYYDPTLVNAYKSVQYLTNKVFGGSLLRNTHRWIAFSVFITVLFHMIRSTLRKDFMSPKKRIEWLTGTLLLLPILLFIITGIVLPWEWKGYWFMEMVPNYSEFVPYIGPFLKHFFIDIFTLPRTFVIHILILPIISFVLVDYHFLTNLRKRGIFKYILRHLLIALPFIILLIILAKYVTIPSEDPEVIPLPEEGRFIPAPEWYFLTILLPFMYYRGSLITILSIYTPLLLFIAFSIFPFFLKGRTEDDEIDGDEQPNPVASGIQSIRDRIFSGRVLRKLLTGTAVVIIVAIFVSLLYRGAYNSPTYGCNGCHNLARGQRMGVPPEAFRDRHVLPNLNNNQWMMGHWFYPNEVW